MPANRISMRKLRDILRLKWDAGLGHRQIARCVKVSHSTVGDYLQRAERAGLCPCQRSSTMRPSNDGSFHRPRRRTTRDHSLTGSRCTGSSAAKG